MNLLKHRVSFRRVFQRNFDAHHSQQRQLYSSVLISTEQDLPAVEKKKRTRKTKTASNENAASLSQASNLSLIKGLRPISISKLQKAGFANIEDLIAFAPKGYHYPSLYLPQLQSESRIPTSVCVKKTDKIMVSNYKGWQDSSLTCIFTDSRGDSIRGFWRHRVNYILSVLGRSDRVVLHGNISFYRDMASMYQPQIFPVSSGDKIPSLYPLYVIPVGLMKDGYDITKLNGLIQSAMEVYKRTPEVGPKEYLPASWPEKRGLLPLVEAYRCIHQPTDDFETKKGMNRLKYDELFLLQLKLATISTGRISLPDSHKLGNQDFLFRRFKSSLGFSLTQDQESAIHEIVQDLRGSKERYMRRLLHGDTGCGKTAVMLASMCFAMDSDWQCAIMAPTEILAQQHFTVVKRYVESIGVKAVLLLGGLPARARRQILKSIESGEAQIIIGTHALFQEKVVFRNLRYAAIDEQQKFGVVQRENLVKKGITGNLHLLLTSATPIPRSIGMSLYGAVDITTIKQLPSGRFPIKTKLLSNGEKKTAYEKVQEEVARGHQAYFVYPLIDESANMDLQSLTEAIEELKSEFHGVSIGMVHGRQESEEREAIMEEFRKGTIKILAATTVIEVGVDCPKASTIVIQHAERFGMSTLHQLRGRVGRSNIQSYCYLINHSDSDTTTFRLSSLEKSNDGFFISEIDMKTRGVGDFFGTDQSGFKLRYSSIVDDVDLMQIAREDARELLRNDPLLGNEEHKELSLKMKATYPESSLLSLA